MDFRQATNNFADPDFDWEPVQIYEPKEWEALVKDDTDETWNTFIWWSDNSEVIYDWVEIDDNITWSNKRYVKWVKVEVSSERVQYLWADWKLITESLKDYSKKNILSQYKTLDSFINKWSEADKKDIIINELIENWVMIEELEKEVWKDLDPFDLICHIAFDKPALTRRERVDNVKKRNYFEKYSEEAKEVLNAMLDKYAEEWIDSIENIDILKVRPFRSLWSPLEIINGKFWGIKKYLEAVKEVEERIYEVV